MEQYPSDNFIPQREPNEVTLEYVAEPKPYVAYYVQDRPLPGRKTETAAQEPPAKTRRKGHRGLKIFLICLAAVLVLAGGLYAVWWFGLLPDRFYGGDHGDYYDDPGYYYYYGELDESAEPELPVVSADDGVRLVYADGHGDALNLLRAHKNELPAGVMHCFSGSPETAREVLKLGMYIGFTGVLTFKNAKKALKALAEVPEDKLVLETDCPYMAPVPFRGKRCDSRMIPYTAEAAALVRGTDTQTILEQTCRNGERLFHI